ncbi:MAG: hypothetical protein WDA27_12545 [Actinomycetota bacterium]
MKRILLAALAVAAVLPVVPARATTTPVLRGTHTFPVAEALPCAGVCSYLVPHTSDPEAFVASWNLLEDDPQDRQTTFACTEPSPAGSFLDVTLNVPSKANFLKIEATPTIDWDIVLCLPGNKGMVAFEDVPYLEDCPAGCLTVIQLRIRPATGKKPAQYSKLVLRAYNFSDVQDLTATWGFYTV